MSESEKHHFHLKKRFFTGLIFLIPIGVTAWLLTFLLQKARWVAGPFIEWLLEVTTLDQVTSVTVNNLITNVASLIVVLGVIFFIGWLTSFYLGKKLLDLVDSVMLKLPFVRSVYGGAKQIIDAFSVQRTNGSFKKVVMLEYPLKGSWVLGFVTNESMNEAKKLFGRDVIAVFVPSTPNPTTGFLLYLDPFDLYVVNLNVDEAVKLIVSAGLVLPGIGEKEPPRTLGEDLGLARPQSASETVST